MRLPAFPQSEKKAETQIGVARRWLPSAIGLDSIYDTRTEVQWSYHTPDETPIPALNPAEEPGFIEKLQLSKSGG
jgi:hypothetical protein